MRLRSACDRTHGVLARLRLSGTYPLIVFLVNVESVDHIIYSIFQRFNLETYTSSLMLPSLWPGAAIDQRNAPLPMRLGNSVHAHPCRQFIAENLLP